MSLITLTTDFGLCDSYVGVMKGVILSIAPTARIVDLCHGIPPQDIVAGALALDQSTSFFPAGTIHVAVVDPGVGSARTTVIIETERATYIGPDNGLFDLVVQRERFKHAVELKYPRYRLPVVSATFHGRDIFAPAAAHRFSGVPMDDFGPAMDYLPKLKLTHPLPHGETLQVHILRVDHFGNIVTDLTPSVLSAWNPDTTPLTFEFLHSNFTGVVSTTYADVPEGAPVAYFGSSGRLEIAIRNGNAAGFFKAARGFSVAVKKW
ncbi:MAG: SAM-dependent chlorinase/fluorinase [Planctomycetota bacterium]